MGARTMNVRQRMALKWAMWLYLACGVICEIVFTLTTSGPSILGVFAPTGSMLDRLVVLIFYGILPVFFWPLWIVFLIVTAGR